MPKLNESNDYAFGIDSYVGINDIIIKQNAQKPAWINQDEIIYQANAFSPSGQFIEKYNKVTKQFSPYLTQGGGDIAAGNNVSLIFLAGKGLTVTNDGVSSVLSQAGFGDVGVDGSYQYNQNYQVKNSPFSVYDFNNWVRLDGPNLYCSWQSAPLVTLHAISNVKLVVINNVRWLLYNSDNNLVLHPSDSLIGYIISSSGATQNPDMNDSGFIVWSTTTGERVGQNRTFQVDFNAPRIDLAPTQPVYTLPIISKYSHPVYVGFSWVPSGHSAPGNCQFLGMMAGEPVQDYRLCSDQNRAIFADGGSITLARSPKLMGQIGSTEGGYDPALLNNYKKYVSECIANNTRPCLCDDGVPGSYPYDLLNILPNYGIPIKECYPLHGELSANRHLVNIDALNIQWSGDFGICIPVYTQQGNWDKQAVLNIHSQINGLVNKYSRLKIIWIFPRERNGVGGPNQDSDMMEMGNRIANAQNGIPNLTSIGNTPTQDYPINNYDELMKFLSVKCK